MATGAKWYWQYLALRLDEDLDVKDRAYRKIVSGGDFLQVGNEDVGVSTDLSLGSIKTENPNAYWDKLLAELRSEIKNISILFETDWTTNYFVGTDEMETRGRLKELARDLSDIYGRLLEWTLYVRSTPVPAAWEPAYLALSRLAQRPLTDIRYFSDQLLDLFKGVSSNDDSESSDIPSLTLRVRMDDAEIEAALSACKRALLET